MSENDRQVNAQPQPAHRRRGCLFWAAIVAGVLLLVVCALAGPAGTAHSYPAPSPWISEGGPYAPKWPTPPGSPLYGVGHQALTLPF
jgi:hypothetical protein